MTNVCFVRSKSQQLCRLIASHSSLLEKTQPGQSSADAVFKHVCMCFCRNCSSYDPCDKSRHGHVLGNIPMEPDGNNGEKMFVATTF